MNRRSFLQNTLLTAGVASLPVSLSAANGTNSVSSETEYYELRRYHLQTGPMVKRLEEYLRDAALPALRRAGAGPVGVFSNVFGPGSPSLQVLIPYSSITDFAASRDKLRDDAEYQKLAKDFLDAPKASPSYIRVESSLLAAISGMPKLVVPEKKPRIFEMRTYESHSDRTAELKVQMFNDAELGIFRRTGLDSVFFGTTLIGANQPNLVYMLCFPDMAAREKNWSAFGSDPEWKSLRTSPRFGGDVDSVSNISNVILRPTAYSQI